MAKIISFEGVDCCGKTTQIGLVRSFLESAGFKVLTIREPGGSPVGEHIREFLKKNTEYLSTECELFLFLAARSQMVAEKIIPIVHKYDFVLLDRYCDSSYAYQGASGLIAPSTIESLNRMAIVGMEPSLTFLLDIPYEELRKRMGVRKVDYIESKGEKFFNRVIGAYRHLANAHARIKQVDGTKCVNDVFSEIKRHITMFCSVENSYRCEKLESSVKKQKGLKKGVKAFDYEWHGMTKNKTGWARFAGFTEQQFKFRMKKFNNNIEMALFAKHSYKKFEDKLKRIESDERWKIREDFLKVYDPSGVLQKKYSAY